MKFPDALRCERGPLVVALAVTALHLATARGYGIFRDELYYLACAEHLDWGYVDHPPLVAVMLAAVKSALGTTLIALRAVPAVLACVTAWLAAAMARQFGGGGFAQTLAAVAVALAPQYLGMLSLYSMNAMDLAIWAGLSLTVAVILKSGDGRGWLVFGALAGLGLQNKLTVLVLCFGVAAGLLLARRWEQMRDWRLWAGAGIALATIAPHFVWQAAHGWPTAEFVRNAAATKNVDFAPVAFLGIQALMMNPVSLPVWVAGLVYLLRATEGRRFRVLGFAYLAVLGLMLTQNSKPYYMAGIYPLLYAAGGVAVERMSRRAGLGWLRAASMGLLVISGAALAPLAKPLLSVDNYVAYAERLGVKAPSDERHEMGRLPQHFADMHGWRELAEAVARVHRALPEEDRGRACVYGQNYGQAGAIDHFGPALGLPRAMSGHNSYWMWGPGECDGQVVIIVGGRREDHARAFETVEEGGRFESRDAMPYEARKTIWVARRIREPLAEAWQRVKHYN